LQSSQFFHKVAFILTQFCQRSVRRCIPVFYSPLPRLIGTRPENFDSFHCLLQNGVHVLHPLQDQTGRSRTVPDLGCERTGKNSLSHFCDCGVRPGIVVKEKDVFRISVRTNSYGLLVAVCLTFPYAARDVLRSRDREFYNSVIQRLTDR
jgi:hypothetical protein